jgi:hypothetical protein
MKGFLAEPTELARSGSECEWKEREYDVSMPWKWTTAAEEKEAAMPIKARMCMVCIICVRHTYTTLRMIYRKNRRRP